MGRRSLRQTGDAPRKRWKNMADYIKQVTVTGDVSKIADDDKVLRAWCTEVALEISEQKAEFAIVHVQGLRSAQDPDFAARVILGCITDDPEIYRQFECSRAYFDTRLTGLGSLYLFRKNEDVQYFDRFSNTGYHQVRSGHDHSIGSTECSGFMQNTFNNQYNFSRDFYRDDGSRDVGNQRTGFLLARYRIFGKEMTFVNVNLHSVPFEDVNEIVEQPAVTQAAQKRQQQIDHLLRELDEEGLRGDSVLVAGAFNAQLHETQLLDYLAKTQMLSTVAKRADDGAIQTIEHIDRHGRQTTTVERSRFDLHSIHDWFFKLGRGQMVKKYNGEMAAVVFKGALKEESVFFQPSRHYFVTDEGKEEFMRTLCPAWADRVLYNEHMDALFRHDSFSASGLYYGLVGENKPIGQYKPVALHSTICLK